MSRVDHDRFATRLAAVVVTAGSFTAATRKWIRTGCDVAIDVWRRCEPAALNRFSPTLVTTTVDYSAVGGAGSSSAMTIRLDRYRRQDAGPTDSNEAT